MAKDEILSKLSNIICDYVDIDKNKIVNDMSITNDIGLDSFGLISMICAIEDGFSVKIPEYELSSFQTIGDMVGYISANT